MVTRNGRMGSDRRRFMAAGGAALAFAALPVRRAAAGEDWLADRALRIVVASNPGSGNDTVARLFAGHLRRHLPATDIAVENVGNGGGRVAEKLLYESEPDGLTLAFLRSSMVYRIYDAPQDYPYDLNSFGWLGSLSRERRILLAATGSAIRDLAGLRALERPVRLAVDSVSATAYREALFLNAMLGLRLQPVPGYDAGASNLAVLAGEVDGRIANYETLLPVIEAGGGHPVLQLNGAALPAPYAGVEQLDAQTVDPAYDWLRRLMHAESDLGRFAATGPGVAPERLARLRALFLGVARDPDFAEQALAAGLLVDPLDGDALVAALGRLPRPDADTVARLQAAMSCGLQRAEGAGACAPP